MGISHKALLLLKAIAKSNIITASIILPKVQVWLNTQIQRIFF